jgi:hypothetical protein
MFGLDNSTSCGAGGEGVASGYAISWFRPGRHSELARKRFAGRAGYGLSGGTGSRWPWGSAVCAGGETTLGEVRPSYFTHRLDCFEMLDERSAGFRASRRANARTRSCPSPSRRESPKYVADAKIGCGFTKPCPRPTMNVFGGTCGRDAGSIRAFPRNWGISWRFCLKADAGRPQVARADVTHEALSFWRNVPGWFP